MSDNISENKKKDSFTKAIRKIGDKYGISRDRIERAISDLYGSFDKLDRADPARDLLDEIYSTDDKKKLYDEYRKEEIEGFEILKQADSDYKGFLNRDNVNDVIAAIRAKKESRK